MQVTSVAHDPALPTAALASPHPTEPVVGLDSHQRHVEAGDAPEVGDVLTLGRDRAAQPARLDVRMITRRHQMSGSSVVAHCSTSML